MNNFPLWLQCIHNISAGFIIVVFGSIIVNLRPNWRKVLIITLFYAIISVYVESLPLPFGFRSVSTLIIISTISMVFLNLRFYRTMIAILIGITAQYLLDGLTIPIIVKLAHINIQQPPDLAAMLLQFLPQLSIACLVIFLCIHYDFHLFDFSEKNQEGARLTSVKRERLVYGLYVCILIFVVFEMIYNLNDFGYFLENGINTVDLHILDWISNVTVVAAILIVSFVLKQLLELSEKESEYIIQKSYLETLEELHTAIRAQQHDLINHFQTLYGFLQLQNTQEATRYLESLLGNTPVLRSYAASGSVPLSALFYIKAGVAIDWNIDFDLDIRIKLNHLNLPPYELNRMVGNLINNAFDAVACQELPNRWVKIKVDQNAIYFIIEICNYGNLSDDTIKKMMSKGFTTKDKEHDGLGLFIVKNLAEKYEGKLLVHSQNSTITMSLLLPRMET
ncbi:MAG TPA: GHKL domain-containing protein [Syntrophomonadaceae bacterium]|nr:GHKL domain-containing protein [Syntrophomonadaceae bacterium]